MHQPTPVPLSKIEERTLLDAFTDLSVEERAREFVRILAVAARARSGTPPALPVSGSRAAVGEALVLELKALAEEAEALAPSHTSDIDKMSRRYMLGRRLSWLAAQLGNADDGVAALSSVESKVLTRFGRRDLLATAWASAGILYHALATDLGLDMEVTKVACESLARRGLLVRSGKHGARFSLDRAAEHPFLIEIQRGAAAAETYLADEIDEAEVVVAGAREVGACVRLCLVLKAEPR